MDVFKKIDKLSVLLNYIHGYDDFETFYENLELKF